MEVFHGLSAMEACNTLDGYYPGFSFQKETKTLDDMLSMAFLSGISSDVEHFEDHFQPRPEDRKLVLGAAKVPAHQPDYSPPMESQDSFGEQWLNDLLPPDNVYSPPITSHQDYQSSFPNAFVDPQVYSREGAYGSGAVFHETASGDSYPSSPLSSSTLDGSDISDLLDIVEELKTEPGMYSFTACSPPQAVPDMHPATFPPTTSAMPSDSAIHELLTSPPAHYAPQPLPPPPDLSLYTSPLHLTPPLHGAVAGNTTATATPRAKDLNGMQDVEKLLMAPLPVKSLPSSSPCSKKKSRGNSKPVPGKSLEKRLKKKEQNKSAALRYREKKRNEKNGLGVKQELLEKENDTLKDQVDSLEREIGYLKDLLKEVQKRRMQ